MLRYPTFVDQWPRRERRILTTLIFILLLGFLILSAIVAFLPTSVVDIEFTERFQRARNPWLDSLMKFVSWFGYMPQGAIVVIGTVVLFFLLGRPREGWFMLATALCLPIVFAIKFAFGRMRPRAELWDDFLSGTAYQSFPSGHVALYVTFFGFLIFLMYRLRRYPQPLRLLIASFCIILIALVPVSRVYLGAHWFTDVMAGFIVGMLCLIGICLWYLRAVHGELPENDPDRMLDEAGNGVK